MKGACRVLVVLAALMGAGGVTLAALSVHGADAAQLRSASSMLLFHASALLGTLALAQCELINVRIGTVAAIGFVVAATLFATDLTVRQYAGHRLFPLAAPTGGTLMVASWITLAIAAIWPRRA